ncbi:MAG: PilZ domain-containing protein [Bdellovibrionaceae bacterium]|nr:PilZ domain-containing protein [Pseudobdellovibrionaceae bacterium]
MKENRVIIVDTLDESTDHFIESLHEAGATHIETLLARDLLQRDHIHTANLFLLNCGNLSEAMMSGLLVFAGKNPTSQVLVLAHGISFYAYRQVAAMKNIFILQRPFDPTIFDSLAKKMLSKQSTDLVRHSRFVTNEPARMMVMETGLLIATRMRNYSVGGAFLEYKGISLRVGHNLHLSLLNQESFDSKDRFQLNARVRWIRDGDNPLSSARGIGVQFIDEPRDVASGM